MTKNELLDLVWPAALSKKTTCRSKSARCARCSDRGDRDHSWPRLTFTLSRTDRAEKQNQSDSTPISPARRPDAPLKALVTTAELYGRDDDVAAVAELARRYELVTIVGPAGIGKTRLAQAVAQRLRDEFPDGARIIELAPLADPALVAVTVASALGVPVGDTRYALDLVLPGIGRAAAAAGTRQLRASAR